MHVMDKTVNESIKKYNIRYDGLRLVGMNFISFCYVRKNINRLVVTDSV